MPTIMACCRDALTVAGWLAALSSTASLGAPEVPAEVVWHVPGEGRGTPAVYGHTAFFLSKRHELIALDVRTGQVKWRRQTHGPGDTTAGTSVVVTPTEVIAGDGGLIAFSHAGVERWRSQASNFGNAGVYLGESAGGVLVAGSSVGRLWALDARWGSVRWSLEVTKKRSTTVFAPIVADRIVVAPFTASDDLGSGGLVAADLATGRQIWLRSGAFAGGPLVAGALVLAAQRDGTIHAFDRHSGARQWSIPSYATEPAGVQELRTLALAGRSLIASSLTGLVTAYDLTTRRERWRRTPMAASIVFGMTSDGHTIYVPHLSGRLVALRAADGVERWRTGSDTFGFSWKPLVAAGRLLAASSGAGFFAFRL
jgi:outer membrane protein assembly factor BamB